ncbi:hypothetical protein C2I18_06105 [Paenibacillus sp. PK3_47]|uniref:hypothetical protein n=1 Tax=Paenibacillus sp. PK3_47 TaxID=2072642 RepID=UPI00201E676D|nr:hypothetical protein [Paenibacillus sp. PK3_47]UQZ33166.1 hypothetical protein C2I18_06105 [Paenibacillus sp. PK3_47]
MAVKGLTLSLLMLAAASGLSACSNPEREAGGTDFHTLAQEEVSAPQYLPGDLPIPAGAGITYTEGEVVGGKKSAMLIYETEESMALLGNTYSQYVKDKELEQGTQIIDEDNLIINGKVAGDYSYSIIGSSSAEKPGGAEIIVTWVEN